jgi:hypothetical protein
MSFLVEVVASRSLGRGPFHHIGLAIGDEKMYSSRISS